MHMLYQSVASNYNDDGDSGAPVFRDEPGSQARAYGILWGGVGTSQMFFSTLIWTKAELGSFATIDP